MELFDKLIGLERYQDAFVLFPGSSERRHTLSPERQPSAGGISGTAFPRRGRHSAAAGERAGSELHAQRAGQAYLFSGEPGRAAVLFRRAAEIDEREKDAVELGDSLGKPRSWRSGTAGNFGKLRVRAAERSGLVGNGAIDSRKVVSLASSAQPSPHGVSRDRKSLFAGRSQSSRG